MMECIKLRGDYCCCESPGTDKKYPFLANHGILFSLWIGWAFVCTNVGFQIMFIFYTLKGMAVGWSIIGFVLQTLFTVYSQVLAGWLSDRYKSENHGNRKPYMVIGIIASTIALLFMAAGINSPKNVLGGIYLVGTIINTFGSAFFLTGLNPWLIETTKDTEEFGRTVLLYQYPSIGIFAVLTLIIGIASPVLAIFLIILCTYPLTYLMFSRVKVGDRRPIDPQAPLLPTMRNVVGNQFAFEVAVFLVLIAIAFGFQQQDLLLTLNFTLLKKVGDQGVYYTVFGIIGIPITIVANYIQVKVLSSGSWTYAMLTKKSVEVLIALSLVNFIISSAFTRGQSSNVGVWLYIFVLVLMVPPVVIMFNCVYFYLRDACQADLVVRGVNSFALVQQTINIAPNIMNALVNGCTFAALYSTGYKQNDDDNVDDDQVDTRYDWTDDTLWFLRVTTFIATSLVLMFARYYMETMELNDESSKVINKKAQDLEKPTSRASVRATLAISRSSLAKSNADTDVESAKVNPLHANVKENENEQGVNRQLSGISDSHVEWALSHFSDSEIASFAKPKSENSDYIFFLRVMNVINLVMSILVCIMAASFSGLLIHKRLTNYILVIVVTIVFISFIGGFIESLRVGALAVIIRLSKDDTLQNHSVLEVDRRQNAKLQFKNLLHEIKTGEVRNLDETSIHDDTTTLKSHMSSDKIYHSSLCAIIITAFIIYASLLANYS